MQHMTVYQYFVHEHTSTVLLTIVNIFRHQQQASTSKSEREP